MDVTFHEAGQHQLVGDVEPVITGGVEVGADAVNAAVAHCHVLRPALDDASSEQQITHGREYIASGRATSSGNDRLQNFTGGRHAVYRTRRHSAVADSHSGKEQP